ncbi:hypothetical protein [Nakamurella endophytica]|uniref:Uncharacterized protein n=1 Tax=Nakamurella endophytica TaxID=1748367 RepID=A0A917WE46_9ACTN|nr:hypothetical protein [Nakamurella endophytica]GGL97104.1 hypothetical protein GCM10011594_15970 [Nakamurella endophytica]
MVQGIPRPRVEPDGGGDHGAADPDAAVAADPARDLAAVAPGAPGAPAAAVPAAADGHYFADWTVHD